MAPTLIRSVVVDDILTLNFSDVLRSGLQIDPSKFEVYGNSRIVPVDEVTVDSANAKVELTLSKSVDINDDVKVSYYDLASDQNLSVLEDESGYDVATFVNSNVKNESSPQEGLEVILAEAYENKVTLGFDLEIDADSIPNNGMFRVKANGNSNRVIDIELFAKKREAVLTLAKPIQSNDKVTLNYIDARGDQRDNTLQDRYGNDLDTITGLKVENLEETSSYDAPELLDQYIEGQTITLEFDEELTGGALKKSLFKVKANGRRLKITDAVALEDETVVELTLKNEVPPAFDSILVTYRDIKGDQRKGVIQDFAGNDAEGFRNAELDFLA
jgi:uncharacterized repeat protein (TIGR02059 family)